MNDNSLVSVLIPSYNHENYIFCCLNSIYENDYKKIEIIIIDDGSKDTSIEKIETWHLTHPNVSLKLLCRENKGITVTLNELIQLANGAYLCFIASDDMLTRESISKRVAFLEKNLKKMAVIGDAIVIDMNNKIIYESAIEELYGGNKENYRTDSQLKYSVVKEWSIPGPVLLVRKGLFDIIGFYPEDLVAEDLYFYLRVIGRNFLGFLDESVGFYRIHDMNTWRNPKLKKRISITFIKSYVRNIQYYEFRFKLVIIRKILGRVYLLIRETMKFKYV